MEECPEDRRQYQYKDNMLSEVLETAFEAWKLLNKGVYRYFEINYFYQFEEEPESEKMILLMHTSSGMTSRVAITIMMPDEY